MLRKYARLLGVIISISILLAATLYFPAGFRSYFPVHLEVFLPGR